MIQPFMFVSFGGRFTRAYGICTIPKGPSEKAPKGGQFRGLQNLKLRLAYIRVANVVAHHYKLLTQ